MSAPIQSLQTLLFRRQFLLGPSPYKLTEQWNCSSLSHGLFLSAHPDLQVISECQNGSSVTLLGFAVDPLNPGKTMLDIVRSLLGNGSSIEDIIQLTRPLAGRWVVIYQDPQNTYLFTDPCGFRTLYYFTNDSVFWCGSQPEIIKAVNSLDYDTNEELIHFLMSPNLAKTQSAWMGNKTVYAKCYHLIPNHYLDVNRAEQVRFFPNGIQRTSENISSIVETAVSILQGFYEAIAQQENVAQALTAGWDSRILLAASRKYFHHIHYFVDREGILPENHPDIWVPKRLTHKLGIKFEVMNSVDDPPGWFITLLAHNVTCTRMLASTRSIYAQFVLGETRMNITGSGSEITRPRITFTGEGNDFTMSVLARRLFFGTYYGSAYVENELQKWKKALYSFGGQDINILELLYWEQRMGNWGAQAPSEKDIAFDEISPYNCRLLIETLLSAPFHLRIAPEYILHKKLIQAMWPEALSVPLNPGKNPIKDAIRPLIPSFILEARRKILKNFEK